MERKYELMFITGIKGSEEDRSKTIGDVEKLLSSLGGESIEKNLWGERTLSYPINNETKGYYVIFNFTLAPEKVIDIEKKLVIREDIVRFIVIRDEKEKFMKKNKLREERKKVRMAERKTDEKKENKMDSGDSSSKFRSGGYRRRTDERRDEGSRDKVFKKEDDKKSTKPEEVVESVKVESPEQKIDNLPKEQNEKKEIAAEASASKSDDNKVKEGE